MTVREPGWFPAVFVSVKDFDIQSDDFEQKPSNPGHFTINRLKRVIAKLVARIDDKESELSLILEFRGHMVTVVDSQGSENARYVMLALASDYYFRYKQDGFPRITDLREGERICEASIQDPDRVFGYLHSIQKKAGTNIEDFKLNRYAIIKKTEADEESAQVIRKTY